MTCQNCGNPNHASARFCTKCGRPISCGLSGAEQAELERLKLKNERTKRTWNVLLAIIIGSLGATIAFGPVAGVIAFIIICIISGFVDRKK